MKKIFEKGKGNYKGQSFDRSKVQMKLICDDFNAHLCLYSNKIVGVRGGPTKSDVGGLQK